MKYTFYFGQLFCMLKAAHHINLDQSRKAVKRRLADKLKPVIK